MNCDPSILDWVSALSNVAMAIIAALTALFGIRIFQHQRTSSDVEMALGIFATINGYWDRITDSNSKNYAYDMGQIFAQFEIAARLFNDSVLTKNALPILKDHIVEVYVNIQSSDDGHRFIEHCTSAPSTLVELKKFLNSHFPTALLVQQFTIQRTVD